MAHAVARARVRVGMGALLVFVVLCALLASAGSAAASTGGPSSPSEPSAGAPWLGVVAGPPDGTGFALRGEGFTDCTAVDVRFRSAPDGGTPWEGLVAVDVPLTGGSFRLDGRYPVPPAGEGPATANGRAGAFVASCPGGREAEIPATVPPSVPGAETEAPHPGTGRAVPAEASPGAPVTLAVALECPDAEVSGSVPVVFEWNGRRVPTSAAVTGPGELRYRFTVPEDPADPDTVRLTCATTDTRTGAPDEADEAEEAPDTPEAREAVAVAFSVVRPELRAVPGKARAGDRVDLTASGFDHCAPETEGPQVTYRVFAAEKPLADTVLTTPAENARRSTATPAARPKNDAPSRILRIPADTRPGTGIRVIAECRTPEFHGIAEARIRVAGKDTGRTAAQALPSPGALFGEPVPLLGAVALTALGLLLVAGARGAVRLRPRHEDGYGDGYGDGGTGRTAVPALPSAGSPATVPALPAGGATTASPGAKTAPPGAPSATGGTASAARSPGGPDPEGRDAARPVLLAAVLTVVPVLTAWALTHDAGDRAFPVLAAALVTAMSLALACYLVPAELYRRRMSGIPSRPEPLAGACALALVAATAALVTDTAPGHTYAFLLGCVPVAARGLRRRHAATAVLRGTLLLLVAGSVAWLVRVPLTHHLDDVDGNAPLSLVFLEAVLGQLFVAAVVSLVIGLLPLPFLDGHVLWRASPGVWATAYALPLLLFLLALLDPAGVRDGDTSGIWLRGLPLLVLAALVTTAAAAHHARNRHAVVPADAPRPTSI